VRLEHGAVLDTATVEDLVASLARVGPHEERRLEVAGRIDGGERTITITSTELASCLDGHLRPILGALDSVLADTPPRLIGDIEREGIILCGGGARLEGLDGAIAAATGIEVHRDSQPQLCAVRGTGYALDNLARPEARPDVHPLRPRTGRQRVASIPASTSSTRIWSMLASPGSSSRLLSSSGGSSACTTRWARP